jgi:hypothetical protein
VHRSILLAILLGGCVADAPEPRVETEPVRAIAVSNAPVIDEGQVDICAVAATLAADDICSLMCDPTAMAAQLVADGNTPGTCYELFCALPGDTHALVGVCLPPG